MRDRLRINYYKIIGHVTLTAVHTWCHTYGYILRISFQCMAEATGRDDTIHYITKQSYFNEQLTK